ncbi:hypothetical protein LPMP_340860 [Leishmania panamensis]|uniref:Transmembrane protein n=2 Tax=Leishmania guyanensis species complex TaxID=38579 RepID=A0A088SIS6_LEIPA|nr:hypothetical protein LPMP_340860 [Leishmania panamensis]AIO01712.1 hypothetical protein LPMP_340860 [Leishmania panamensis]
MHKVSRVMTAAAAAPTVGTRPGWQALQQTRHSVQGSFMLSPLPSSSPLLRLSTSHLMTTTIFPWVQRYPHSLAIAVRLHAAPSGEAVVTSTSASASSPRTSSSSGNLGSDNGMCIDPRRLPNTIPGITQEELAARITQYHAQQAKLAREISAKALAHDVELMRRSMTPNSFAEYMVRLEKEQQAAVKEEAKMAAMSPVELHQYRQKKRRQAVRYEWYKTFLLLSSLAGSTVFLFSLFIFFK